MVYRATPLRIWPFCLPCCKRANALQRPCHWCQLQQQKCSSDGVSPALNDNYGVSNRMVAPITPATSPSTLWRTRGSKGCDLATKLTWIEPLVPLNVDVQSGKGEQGWKQQHCHSQRVSRINRVRCPLMAPFVQSRAFTATLRNKFVIHILKRNIKWTLSYDFFRQCRPYWSSI